jgi:hypothetical protein
VIEIQQKIMSKESNNADLRFDTRIGKFSKGIQEPEPELNVDLLVDENEDNCFDRNSNADDFDEVDFGFNIDDKQENEKIEQLRLHEYSKSIYLRD